MHLLHRYLGLIVLTIVFPSCSVIFNSPALPIKAGVFGQTSLTSLQHLRGFFTPVQAIQVGQKLIVTDSNTQRVLIYNKIPSQSDLPDVTLGSSKGYISLPQTTSPITDIGRPLTGIASDGTRLVVSDASRNRVLIWNKIPTQDGTLPDVVLGQPDMNTISASCSAAGMTFPTGVWIDSGVLYVSDTNNRRVLVYSSIPTVSGATPDYYIGQSGPATCTSGCSSTSLNSPGGIYSQNGILYISDVGNHRVLLYNLPISSSSPTAFRAFGSASLSTCTLVNPPTANTLRSPVGITGDGVKIAVGDTGNNRILIWNSVPLTNGYPADVVLGQDTMITRERNLRGVSGSSFLSDLNAGFGSNALGGIWLSSSGTSLIASDIMNSRVLVWNSFPTSNFASADRVFGQPSFSGSFPGGSSGDTTINYPSQLLVANGKFLAGSTFSTNGAPHQMGNRVLVWNSVPIPTPSNFFSLNPNIVIGQSTFFTHSAAATPSQTTLTGPFGLAWANNLLYVGEASTSRILIFDGIPTSSGAAASGVIGQSDFTSTTLVTTISGIKSVLHLAATSEALYVTDPSNNRVLVFSPPPPANAMGPSASFVLGQIDFNSASSNAGGISASSLSSPRGIAAIGKKLLIADYGNNRVLIWNSLLTQNNQAADLVLGQPDFTSNTLNNGGISASTMANPRGVWTDGRRVLVADSLNNRVLYWKTFPTKSGAPADVVFGQSNFLEYDINSGGVSHQSLNYPTYAMIEGSWIYISDTLNQRILVLPAD